MDALLTIRYLVLFVTGACNLRCKYCYEADIPARPMSLSVASKALDLAAASNEPFHVQLTGGEPTMAPQTIARIASMIKERQLKATIGLQTNGTLLDDELIDLLIRYQIEIGISLDGIATVHDAQRGLFNKTLQGLTRLMKRNIPCRITTVVTEKSALHLDKLVLLLAGFPNVLGVGLDLLTLRRAAIDNHVLPVSVEQLESAVEKLRRASAFVNQNRTTPLTIRELDTRHFHGCHASLGESVAVLPDGKLFPCSQTAGDPTFALGDLDAGAPLLEKRDEEISPLRIPVPDCPSRTYYNNAANLSLSRLLSSQRSS